MAADAGYSLAQWRLGCAHENVDFGVKIDLEVARTWFQEAAEGGDRPS